MKIVLVFLLGFLSYLANNSMFFFSEELVIAGSLVVFFFLLINMLRGIFLRAFFMEAKAIYIVFNYLFTLNLMFISVVSQCVNFLTLKYKYFFGGEFYFSIINSYVLYLKFQRQQIFYIVDKLIYDVLKRFFLYLLNVTKFSFNLKQVFFNVVLYIKIKLEKTIIKNTYKFLC